MKLMVTKMATSKYVERAKKEKNRNKLATDDGFWFAICFRTMEDKENFVELLNLPDEKFIPGPLFEKATENYKPKGKRRNIERKIPPNPSFNPLVIVERTGDLEEDCFNEAMVIYAAFSQAEPPEKLRYVSDSNIWICVCFRSTEDAQRYQTEMRLGKFGSRYVDGSAWLRELMKHGKDTETTVQTSS